MQLSISHIPSTALKAAKLQTDKANELFTSLTVAETESLFKLWLYETLLELQLPEEALTPLFMTRIEAAELLGITTVTLDKLSANGVIKYQLIGKKRVYLQTDLANSLMESNKLKSK